MNLGNWQFMFSYLRNVRSLTVLLLLSVEHLDVKPQEVLLLLDVFLILLFTADVKDGFNSTERDFCLNMSCSGLLHVRFTKQVLPNSLSHLREVAAAVFRGSSAACMCLIVVFRLNSQLIQTQTQLSCWNLPPSRQRKISSCNTGWLFSLQTYYFVSLSCLKPKLGKRHKVENLRKSKICYLLIKRRQEKCFHWPT